jgi:hypothetical protein
VAQYCSLHLPDYIKEHPLFKDGKLKEALEVAFLGFDQKLLEKDALDEMRVLAGIDEEEDEEGETSNTLKQCRLRFLWNAITVTLKQCRLRFLWNVFTNPCNCNIKAV